MKYLKYVEHLLAYKFDSMPLETLLRIDYFLGEYAIVERMQNSGHNTLSHSIGVSKHALYLYNIYINGFELINADLLRDTIVISAFLHDSGKILEPKSNNYSIHDSINLELSLRKVLLAEIAQSIRHNPYLILFDLRNGNLTLPQFLVTYADTCVDTHGIVTDRAVRLNNILAKKNINKEFQEVYWNILQQIFDSKAIMDTNSRMEVGFVERCDGKYPIKNEISTLDTLSSYHLAKNLSRLGYHTTIYSNSPENFTKNEVNFKSVGNNPLTVYNSVRKNDFLYITGWTAIFKSLLKNNNVLPMLVMRSLKINALTTKRLKLISESNSRTILVSDASVEYLNNNFLTNKLKAKNDFYVIDNGIDKNIFKYKKNRINKVFLYVGAMVNEKGINYVFELAKNLPDYECLMIGSSEMYGIRELVNNNDIPKNVKFMGMLPQSKIAELLSTAQFSVLFTDKKLIFETFGKSICESQSCGCPILYLKNGGIIENTIDDSMNFGLQDFSVNDYVNFVRDNENNFTKSIKRKLLAKKANKKYHNWEYVALKYMTASYEELLMSLKLRLSSRRKILSYLLSS